MATTLIATYANGVFKPDTPVILPENTQVELSFNPPNGATQTKPAPGSKEAMEEFLRHCRASTFNSGEPRPTRDELYEGR